MKSKSDREELTSNKPLSKESFKNKTEEASNCGKVLKNKTKTIMSPFYEGEKKDKKTKNSNAGKKRRRSSSSNSSVTYNSYDNLSVNSHSPRANSSKEHDTKTENKKQKSSSKDVVNNSASSVKKESSTSTKISFSNNNSGTTIEIKSVKKEKTWDSEVKKSKSKEFKSSEIKSSKESLNSNSYSSASKSKNKEDKSPKKSPKVGTPKVKDRKNVISHESSSSPESVLSGEVNTPGRDTSRLRPPSRSGLSEDQGSLSSSSSPFRHRSSSSLDSDGPAFKKLKSQNVSKRKKSKSSKKPYCEKISRDKDSTPFTSSSSLSFRSSNSNEMVILQKRISELQDSNVLQRIVDIIEDTGHYEMTNVSFDFDLMKLDDVTIRKLKNCLT